MNHLEQMLRYQKMGHDIINNAFKKEAENIQKEIDTVGLEEYEKRGLITAQERERLEDEREFAGMSRCCGYPLNSKSRCERCNECK